MPGSNFRADVAATSPDVDSDASVGVADAEVAVNDVESDIVSAVVPGHNNPQPDNAKSNTARRSRKRHREKGKWGMVC